MASSSFDVDDVITKLLEVRGSRPGKQVNLTETDLGNLNIAGRVARARQQRRVVERAKAVHDEREEDAEDERNFGGSDEPPIRRGEGGAELLTLCAQVRGEQDHGSKQEESP